MRILHTESSVNWGGQEFRALEQMQWFNANGHVAALAARPGSDIGVKARALGIQVTDIPFHGHYQPRSIAAARRLVRDMKIDIADCHGSRDVMTLSFARGLCPVIRSRHLSTPIKNKLHRRLQWRYGSDHVIATAHCIKDEILGKSLAPAEKITVIGEWAEDGFFDVAEKQRHRTEVRKEFGVRDSHALVCVVGMLRGDKAQEILIETVAQLARRGQPVTALIVGSVTNSESDYDEKLMRRAKQLNVNGRIRFTGYREDISRLTQACDAQVITSISVEAQSRTAPQAFASRTPLVAGRVGGVGELVTPGQTGWLVEAGNITAYADALLQVLDHEQATAAIVENARTFAEQNLRMDSKMQQTLDVYQSVIDARKDGRGNN